MGDSLAGMLGRGQVSHTLNPVRRDVTALNVLGFAATADSDRMSIYRFVDMPVRDPHLLLVTSSCSKQV